MRRKRVLLADDVRNTGQTFARCAALVNEAGGTVIGTVEICDRCEATVDIGVPDFALTEYLASKNYTAAEIHILLVHLDDHQARAKPRRNPHSAACGCCTIAAVP